MVLLSGVSLLLLVLVASARVAALLLDSPLVFGEILSAIGLVCEEDICDWNPLYEDPSCEL